MFSARHGKQWLSSDVINWCDEHFHAGTFYYHGDRFFDFVSERDLTWFLLRWA